MSATEPVFADRHIGPRTEQAEALARDLGHASLAALMDAVVPPALRPARPLILPAARSETQALADLAAIAGKNQTFRSYLGMGYHAAVLPPVLQRCVLENPGWYTPYTPYQAEISQGRLEALLAFQTLICELTGLAVANASMLDEATACAEAMAMAFAAAGNPQRHVFFAARDNHPQVIEVLRTRARPLGIELVIGDHRQFAPGPTVFGGLFPYPATDGAIHDLAEPIAACHAAGALAVVCADPLALCLLTPPASFGADICVGSVQRFGLPLGYGGPHAGYLATTAALTRRMPGRLVGMSKDAHGRPALRLSLQTREQHIRREKAGSNICTSQALLANLAAFYAIWHGPEGLTAIANRIHRHACVLAAGLRRLGHHTGPRRFFDTVRVDLQGATCAEIIERAEARGINVRPLDSQTIGIALDETVGEADLLDLLRIFNRDQDPPFALADLGGGLPDALPAAHRRRGPFLAQPLFHQHRSELSMMRYLKRLENRDYGLCHGMIPLGSCTMKLSAAAEMAPITWPALAGIHPFAPRAQARGWQVVFQQLEQWLAECTGFDAVSLQPNAGSQGEYAGLLAIRAWHQSRGQGHRRLCLIPTSAHGTNPASSTLAGLDVLNVACDAQGNVDLTDLAAKASAHAADLAVLMLTYPSTHGVFETRVREICAIVHQHGGQVYMDGANMNAQVGWCSPGDLGADVCHLNLHKTFAIPHGGGGPGVGPICVARHLAPFLPKHPVVHLGGETIVGPVSAAPWGSALVTAISWMYICMMGADGLKRATAVAILNANHIARRLAPHFPILYTGPGGLVAHECILDLRPAKKTSGISEEDVAKRLMDYGFHAPTVSFPVAGTLMVEPTESEDLAELDRFCDAMIRIADEIRAVADGKADRNDNVLHNAPHTAEHVTGDTWTHPYTRQQAAFPAPWSAQAKYWPPVGRVDAVSGDRNFCGCLPPG